MGLTGLTMADVPLAYLHSFIDARGKPRHVFRRKGHKQVTIKGAPGSPEFLETYNALIEKTGGALSLKIGTSDAKAGSVDAWAVAYLDSAAFKKGLAKDTQKAWRPILERFRQHRTPSGRRCYGENQIATLAEKQVRDFLAGKTANQQKNELKAVRGFIRFAISEESCGLSHDPTIGITAPKKKGPKSKGHLTWLEPQVEQYRKRWPLGTMARLALELLLNIAARRYDAHLIGEQHAKDSKLTWRPHKTLRSTGKQLVIGITSDLRAALDAIPKGMRADGVLTFLVNDYGRPFASPAAFGNKFADWCRGAGLKPVLCDDGRVRSYRAHGLRKAALRTLAHAGCTGAELMAISGHATLAQVQVYIDEVEQESMADAAMNKLANSAVRTAREQPVANATGAVANIGASD
ncbi:tyrosine-type recombinase/integrase [Bradyrhizobium quebecense]|uniref:Uncharacterized protein n=2 Tax=Bradyrhizobium quebecense TaxID=2748629 RepID=A0ACD3VA12_9BRAD|nr:hypothetical protein [Bradyrhizobium quebecense]UGY03261.1 hypothetical protein J4P68_0000315 [Bradyrhizobium quebecense]